MIAVPVDNTELIRPFVPAMDDGDTFTYTEILDRTVRKGNNGSRVMRTFYHRSHEDFDLHLPAIRSICDHTGARAYTRLSTRSWRRAGKRFTAMVVEASLTDNWAGMKTLYPSACAKSKPVVIYWMFDVDVVDVNSKILLTKLDRLGAFVTAIPSRTGQHFVTRPFNPCLVGNLPDGISLIRDSNVNLYIPAGFSEHNKTTVVVCSKILQTNHESSTDVQRSTQAYEDETSAQHGNNDAIAVRESD